MTAAEIDCRRAALGWTKAKLAQEAQAAYSSTRHLLAGRTHTGPQADFLLSQLAAALAREEQKRRAYAAFHGEPA